MTGLPLPLPVLVLLSLVGYTVYTAIYRLYLSPLAKFPGPKLAALTKWYEAYYEIVLKGQFTFHIDELHKQYGPIIRVTPDEIHIKDPSFWETLYVKHNKASRYEWTAGRFGNNGSVLTTSDATLHKSRRAPLNGMFSRRAILAFEPVVHQKMQILVDGLTKFFESGAVCKISEAYSAFAGDVITEYSFGFSYDHLKLEGFSDSFHDAFMAVSEFGHTALQFPWMHPILNSLPDSWNKAMNPPLAKLLDLQRDLRAKVQRVREDVQDPSAKKPDHPTIFHTLLESDLPEAEKSNLRMGEEAQLVLGAGIETTAWALANTTFYVLNNPAVLSKLKAELEQAIPDVSAPAAFDSTKLEVLPYLRGCVKEGIRLGLSVTARNQRILDTPLAFDDWEIPPGTPISMTIPDAHLSNDFFPEAREFKPERWIGEAKAPDGSPLERYFVAFGKGPRSCLGINLAYMELFIAIATVFRKFQLELHGTDISDVRIVHDFFLPSPKLDSKGIRVRVVGLEK